jgi:hypothetical protein
VKATKPEKPYDLYASRQVKLFPDRNFVEERISEFIELNSVSAIKHLERQVLD